MMSVASFVIIQINDTLHMQPKYVAGLLNKVYTDMRRLTTGNCVFLRFRRFCERVLTQTYIAQYSLLHA